MTRARLSALAVTIAFVSVCSTIPADAVTPAGATTHWSTTYYLPPNAAVPGSSLNGAAATAGNDVWAVGSRTISAPDGEHDEPILRHWDGSTWSIEQAPKLSTDPQFFGVTVESGLLWLIGSNDVSTLSGSTWRNYRFPSNVMLATLRVFAPDDAWALGTKTVVTSTTSKQFGVAYHWNGISWQMSSLPAGVLPTQMSAAGTSQWVPASTSSDQAALLDYNGYQWTAVGLPELPMPSSGDHGSYVNDVLDLGNGELWATVGYDGHEGLGSGLTLLQHTGTSWASTSWRRLTLPDDALGGPGLVSDGSDGVWAVGGGLGTTSQLIHVAGGHVTKRTDVTRVDGLPFDVSLLLGTGSSLTVVGSANDDGSAGASVATYTPDLSAST